MRSRMLLLTTALVTLGSWAVFGAVGAAPESPTPPIAVYAPAAPPETRKAYFGELHGRYGHGFAPAEFQGLVRRHLGAEGPGVQRHRGVQMQLAEEGASIRRCDGAAIDRAGRRRRVAAVRRDRLGTADPVPRQTRDGACEGKPRGRGDQNLARLHRRLLPRDTSDDLVRSMRMLGLPRKAKRLRSLGSNGPFRKAECRERRSSAPNPRCRSFPAAPRRPSFSVFRPSACRPPVR